MTDVERLRNWLRHKDWCRVKTDDLPGSERCTCGLTAALAARSEPDPRDATIERLTTALRVATHKPHDQDGGTDHGFPVCSVCGAIQTDARSEPGRRPPPAGGEGLREAMVPYRWFDDRTDRWVISVDDVVRLAATLDVDGLTRAAVRVADFFVPSENRWISTDEFIERLAREYDALAPDRSFVRTQVDGVQTTYVIGSEAEATDRGR